MVRIGWKSPMGTYRFDLLTGVKMVLLWSIGMLAVATRNEEEREPHASGIEKEKRSSVRGGNFKNLIRLP